MVLTDRKKLAKLMAIQGVSLRGLARGAGFGSHAYLGRLLRGEANTVTPESAARIALFLGVGVDDLFMAKASTETLPGAHRRATPKAAA
jgi:transcriptional regulator with XRE-family HTH domain